MARLIVKLFVTVWLVVVPAVDLLHRRIANWLVVPVILCGVVWQIYRSGTGRSSVLLFIAISWMVIFAIWRVHIFGGGDAKFLMALFALFPDERFLLLVCLGVVLVAIPFFLWTRRRDFRAGPVETERAPEKEGRAPFCVSSLADLVYAWKTRVSWPSRKKLESRGQPFVWGFALPGVVYVWWLF
ncbi:MAG: A24 family peptidase [Anaerolineae bacterium]